MTVATCLHSEDMKHTRIDARAKALARNVERVLRAQRVPIVKEVQKQAKRVLRAVALVEGSVDAIGAELLRRRGHGRPRRQVPPQAQ